MFWEKYGSLLTVSILLPEASAQKEARVQRRQAVEAELVHRRSRELWLFIERVAGETSIKKGW